MKNYLLLSVFVLVALASCKQSTSGESASDTATATIPTLTKLWETDTLLTTCESVVYDAINDVLYVSNINGTPSEKDGNGSIGKVGMDGQIINANWVTGMDAPKGLGLHNGMLYANDIDKVLKIDVSTGTIVSTIPVDGAIFLNDITVSPDGVVYASDSNGGKIYRIENDQAELWMDNLSGPNGLFFEGNRMLVALWNERTLNTVDLESKTIEAKTDSLMNPDGIEATGNGAYLVSSWNGLIHYVDSDWKRSLLLNLEESGLQSADIEFIPEKNMLLVPTFNSNTVIAYTLE